MIRFIHIADIHFGMENYGKIDSKTGIHTRLLDFERALNFCIDVAIEKEVDFFLFAGDAYKTAHPSPTQQRLLTRCFLRLHKANIPLVMVIGNHDNPLSFGKANSLDIFGQFPTTHFHVIAKPKSFVLQTKSGPVQIVGIPWPTRNTISVSKKHALKSAIELTEYISKAVGKLINNFAQQLDPTIPAVFTGHLTVSSGIFSGSEKRAIYGTDPVLLPSQLAIEPFDYVGLGHLHRYQDLNKNGYPSVVYAGSPERIDFGERKEDKGFCVVTIHEKNKTTHEFIKTPQRPFIQIEVKLTSDKPQTEQMLDAIKKHDLKDAIVKILYHIPENKKDNVDLKEIQALCTEAMFVVGIIPIRQVVVRERRGAMKVDMDIATLLDRYFSAKPELVERKRELIEKTLAIQDEIESQQNIN
ncbi:MAG: exonuclease SbcCD subunit D [Candidatus Dependentiae bacterium]